MHKARLLILAIGLITLVSGIAPREARGATPGVVMDNHTGTAFLFDADTDMLTGSIPLSVNLSGSGDCVTFGDRGPAFVTDFAFHLWELDLEASPPQLAPSNPIRIANPGEDIAVSPDRRFLVTCDGNGPAPVSVVDLATRREVSTFPLGSDCNSVDVCDDGSVLATSFLGNKVRRLMLDASGHLTDTGESLAVTQPMNAYCSPGSSSGLVVTNHSSLQSFAIPGLVVVSSRTLSGTGLTVVFSPDASRIYVRDTSFMHAFDFDPASGQILSQNPVLNIDTDPANTYFGMEQMALDPAGAKLYVPSVDKLKVYSTATGALLQEIAFPQDSVLTGICLPKEPDQDDDGLTDAQEAALGTNPANPDTDGDGLRDGFEALHGLNPLSGGDQGQDPDADGLTNLAEQTARTDPSNPDTDSDGLLDGVEVFTTLTDPRNPDSDQDGLPDGAEVNTYHSDPHNPDTDGGGVRDGHEVFRDGTDPLNPADDSPAGLGMIMDNTSHKAVVFDPETDHVLASLDTAPGIAVGDCVITEDGRYGFASRFDSKLSVVDLQSVPPAPAPAPNPIPISNPGEDISISADGKYLVVCDGNGLSPISVVDVATRTEISTLFLGTDCTSVEVCPDGTVLVGSFLDNSIRRLELSAAGVLSDPGDRMSVPQPVNLLCAPDSRSGLVISRSTSQAVTSFQFPGLTPVDTRPMPEAAFAAALTPSADAVYVRYTTTDAGGIQAFRYDPATAHLGAAPFLAFPVSNTTRFFGMEQLAIDPSGTELYVTEAETLSVLDAATGARLTNLYHPDLSTPTGICLRTPDADHDGLSDAMERRLGTNPNNPDSDGDGLGDGYEASHGFDPLAPGDGSLDPDGDGLDNQAEQAARTDPARFDTDGDGLSDGQEVLATHTDPRDPDSDGDGLNDGVELQLGTNPTVPDTDGGGVRDGNEVNRDGTDPLNPSDDRPSGLGLASSGYGDRVLVFNPETGDSSSLQIASQSDHYACAVSADGSRGYMSDDSPAIWVTEMDASPPRISAQNNPVPLPNVPFDVALTLDGRFLVTCGYRNASPFDGLVSVVDTLSRQVVSTFSMPSACSSVAVCADGSVLAAFPNDNLVTRLELSGSGALSDSGEEFSVDAPLTVRCARDGRSAMVLSNGPAQSLNSFRVRGMVPVDSRAMIAGSSVETMELSPTSDRVYLRRLVATEGIDVYGYDPVTAHFSADRLLQFPTLVNGLKGISVDRSGRRLLVHEGGSIQIHDTDTGAVVGALVAPGLTSVGPLCQRIFDRDSDGLLDDEEITAGTDPSNPDSDGDGLLDGFEVLHGLDPRSAGDGLQDPDGDGLDNLGEQSFGTDPHNPDDDADGLSDGAEVHTYGTNPSHSDSDRDGLSDGAEISTYHTNPLAQDTDGGGVWDGNEVNRDGTLPLVAADDRPSGPGMATDPYGSLIVTIDPESRDLRGSLATPDHSPLDCTLSPSMPMGYFSADTTVRGLNLLPSPPAPLSNPIQVGIYTQDIAHSPDGRFVLACGYTFSNQGSIVVVDSSTQQMIGSVAVPGGCDAMDVCSDGSVLALSDNSLRLHRWKINELGQLTDTGERRDISYASEIRCAPGGEVALISESDQIESFHVQGLAPIDQRTLPGYGDSIAARPTGNHATVFVHHTGPSGVVEYDLNLRTGSFGQNPLLRFPTVDVPGYTGVESIAVDASGAELYVAGYQGLHIYSTQTGASLKGVGRATLPSSAAVCLPAAGDRDGDGLSDAEEHRLGTRIDLPDTDGDGLGDRFEVWNDLNPLVPDDAHQDPDADGLDNLAEQAAQTDPRNADTDADGLTDGAEVLQFHSNPHNPDTDADGYRDGADNCPLTPNPDQADAVHPNGIGDACDDPDHEGIPDSLDNCPDVANANQSDVDGDRIGDVCDACPLDPLNDPDLDGVCTSADNCPAAANPLQGDADADGRGDACDICPSVSNPLQQEQVACLEVSQNGGDCLETRIDLVGQNVSGTIDLYELLAGPPDVLRFEVNDSSCIDVDTFEFELNGVPLGSYSADPSLGCTCRPEIQNITITDTALVASAWRPGQMNEFVFRKIGGGTLFAWVRAVAAKGGVDHVACILDIGGGDCTIPDLCYAGALFDVPEQRISIPDPTAEFGLPLQLGFTGSQLPERIDISSLADGTAKVCVSSGQSGTPRQDCRSFVKQGERQLTVNGAACGRDPVAAIANAGGDEECQSPAGRVVSLDGSASSDPDSSPGTHDDIVAFEWFENYGLSNQAPLGTGELLSSTLALGDHAITLKVTDSTGLTSTAQVQIRIVDTTAPILQVVPTPATLWPPFHQLVSVRANVLVTDACSTPLVTLLSVTSSESDDAPGGSDGQTVNDIQGAVAGTADFQYFLRAERSAAGSGRIYQAVYRAVDGSGNSASATGQILVPHDQSAVRDPISLTLRQNARGTVVDWTDSGGSLRYGVLRGSLSQVRDNGDSIDLGTVLCVQSDSTVLTTEGTEDGTIPPVGETYFYLVEFNLGDQSSYGSDTAIKPRVPGEGACSSLPPRAGTSSIPGEQARSSR